MARRKALTVAVAALCLESGYGNATENALATFTEMIQSCKLCTLIISYTNMNCYKILQKLVDCLKLMLRWHLEHSQQ